MPVAAARDDRTEAIEPGSNGPEANGPEAVGQSTRPRSATRTRARRRRSMRENLGSILIAFELFAIFLSTLTFFGLEILPAPIALGGGALVCVLLIALVYTFRFEWGFTAGWVFHVAMVATGFLHGGMFFVAGVFLATWAFIMIKGGEIDRRRAPIIAEYERALAAGEINPDGSPREQTD
ncbi:MAG: DUF4233 domain-containing protein [Pseudoclavibacter sp.]